MKCTRSQAMLIQASNKNICSNKQTNHALIRYTSYNAFIHVRVYIQSIVLTPAVKILLTMAT